jgi:hypothetical protein
VVLALTLAAAAAVLASIAIPSVLGDAFLSLGRPHRYWPLVAFGIALYGALGADRLIDAAAGRGPPWAMAAPAILVLLAVPSSVAASLALPTLGVRHDSLVREAILEGPRALLDLIAPATGGRCRAAVPLNIDTPTWSYTGYRLVAFDREDRDDRNEARIRWRDIYDHVVPQRRRLRDNRILTQGLANRSEWWATARRYGVDVVVVHDDVVHREPFRVLDGDHAGSRPFTVFRLSGCGT